MKLIESLRGIENSFINVKKVSKKEIAKTELSESLFKAASQIDKRNYRTAFDLTNGYQKALEEAIEKINPDKRWFEVTNCDIRTTLLENHNNIEATIRRILNESDSAKEVEDEVDDIEERNDDDAKELTEETIGSDLSEYQKWVDYDMEHYGKVSSNTFRKITEAGLSLVKDQYGDYEVIADREDAGDVPYKKESCDGESLTEGISSLPAMTDNAGEFLSSIKPVYEQINKIATGVAQKIQKNKNKDFGKLKTFAMKYAEKIRDIVRLSFKKFPKTANNLYHYIIDGVKSANDADALIELFNEIKQKIYSVVEFVKDNGDQAVNVISKYLKTRNKIDPAMEDEYIIRAILRESLEDESLKEDYVDDEFLSGDMVRFFNDYYEAKKYAEKLGFKESEYGDAYGCSYCCWNESGDRNDIERVVAYYDFVNGKPTKLSKQSAIRVKNNTDIDFTESLEEDTVKQGSYWVNKGEEGTHGKFKTKKEADAQRKAMFARGYKAEALKESLSSYSGTYDITPDMLETCLDILLEYGVSDNESALDDILGVLLNILPFQDSFEEFGEDEEEEEEYESLKESSHPDLSEKNHTLAHALKRTWDYWANAKTKEEAVNILVKAIKDEGLDTPATKKFLAHIKNQPLNAIIKTATNYTMAGMGDQYKVFNPSKKKGESLTEDDKDEEAYKKLKAGYSLADALK